MKNTYKCNFEVAQGVMVNLFSGNFLRNFDESPSNFSPFSFPKKSLLSSRNAENNSLYLVLKEVSGKGLSDHDVSAVMKQGVKVPKSIEELRFNIHNTVSAAKFFFSDYSMLPNNLSIAHNHIIKNYSIYESLALEDVEFIAKFLFAIDSRIQSWLESCESKQDREEVDDSIIDFSDLLWQVKVRLFHTNLPASIRNIIDKKKESHSPERN